MTGDQASRFVGLVLGFMRKHGDVVDHEAIDDFVEELAQANLASAIKHIDGDLPAPAPAAHHPAVGAPGNLDPDSGGPGPYLKNGLKELQEG